MVTCALHIELPVYSLILHLASYVFYHFPQGDIFRDNNSNSIYTSRMKSTIIKTVKLKEYKITRESSAQTYRPTMTNPIQTVITPLYVPCSTWMDISQVLLVNCSIHQDEYLVKMMNTSTTIPCRHVPLRKRVIISNLILVDLGEAPNLNIKYLVYQILKSRVHQYGCPRLSPHWPVLVESFLVPLQFYIYNKKVLGTDKRQGRQSYVTWHFL